MSKNNFETNLEKLDEIITELESGELSLDDAIKQYETAMKLIKDSSKILNEAEGKLLKVIEKNGDIDIEEI
nr:exodeoxyribonuclease VII small subunit [uncultured Fusobacterium sp.]